MPPYRKVGKKSGQRIALPDGEAPMANPNIKRKERSRIPNNVLHPVQICKNNLLQARFAKHLFAACLVYGCAANAPIDPQAIEQIHSSKHVAVVAPDVQLVRHSLSSSDEQLRVEDAQAASDLSSLIETELTQRGFIATSAGLTDVTTSSIQSEYDLIAYQQRWEQDHPTLRNDSSLAPDVALIAKKTGVDALMFVRLQGFKRSAGSVAAEVGVDLLLAVGPLMPAKAPNASAELTLTLVSGKSGAILWENQVQENWGLTMPSFGSADMAGMVTKAFETFPQ